MPGSGAPSPALAPSPPSEANVESDVEDHSFAGVALVVSSGSSSLLASERSGSLVVFPIERSSPALEPRALTAEIPRETPPAFAHVATTTTAEEVAKDNDLPAVQVYVRLRPLLEWEQTSGHESTSLDIEDLATVTLRPLGSQEDCARTRNFRFDTVFGPNRTQEDVWNMARLEALVGKVVDGFHATVFAYGQTGSGKTYTMEGFQYEQSGRSLTHAMRPKVQLKNSSPEEMGIVPRVAASLFGKLEALQTLLRNRGEEETHTVRVSFLQIYKERIYDLLNPAHTPAQREIGKGEDFSGLRLRWDAARRQFFVENLFEYECSSVEDVLQHYGNGVQQKQMASTSMNIASSRSHTILALTLVRRMSAGNVFQGTAAPAKEVVSKIALVDLAGSERTSTCQERNAARFSEAVTINQSLFVLRRVITALSRRSEPRDMTHVPYRESKLTSLLQHAVGGNCFLLMFACLSPSDKHFDENLSTLQYASQAASIKNAPKVNLDPKDLLIQQLRSQLSAAYDYILHVTGLDLRVLWSYGRLARTQRTS